VELTGLKQISSPNKALFSRSALALEKTFRSIGTINELLYAFKKAFVPPRERELAEGVHNSYRRLFFSARSGKKQRPTSQEMEADILFSKSRSLIGVVWAFSSGTE
jgi:hypothetical protein